MHLASTQVFEKKIVIVIGEFGKFIPNYKTKLELQDTCTSVPFFLLCEAPFPFSLPPTCVTVLVFCGVVCFLLVRSFLIGAV